LWLGDRPTQERGEEQLGLSRFTTVAFVANAAFAIVLGTTVFITTRNVGVTSQQIGTSLRLIEQLTALEASIARAESAQRGYLLYRSRHFLEQREQALTAADVAMAGVRQLAEDTAPSDRLRTTDLQRMVRLRAQRMRVSAGDVRDSEAAQAPAGQGRELTADIYSITAAMKREMHQAISDRTAEQRGRFRVANTVLGAALLAFLFPIGPAYLALARESRARRRAERSMEQLAEGLPGAVFQYRHLPDGTRQYELLSTRCESIRGVDRKAALQNPDEVMRVVHEGDRRLLANAIAESERKLKELTLDYRIVVNGKTRWIRVVAAPKREADGSVLWSGHWEDVTIRRALEAELLVSREQAIAATRAKSAFLAMMSHEIRTPMNGVLGMLELLGMTDLNSAQQGTVSVIRESAESLLRIIDDILDFSRIEAGRLELRDEPASIAHVVELVSGIYSASAGAKRLALKTQVDAAIAPALRFDALRVQQILNNFTNNAVKFTSHGQVRIGAELLAQDARTQTVRLFVEDTGIGLTAEQQSRIFRPFEQATPDTTARHGGTGLGLSICERLAGMMGGRIELKSAPDCGTTISLIATFELCDTDITSPSAASLPRPKPAPAAQAASDANSGSVLLIVDDHPINRMLLVSQANALGYQADSAESAAQALALWSPGRYAAILTDCNMPEMNGYQLCREIRRREERDGHVPVPIIACTANALPEEAQRCFDAGMNDYVAKPVSLASLGQKLAAWISPARQAPTGALMTLHSLGPDAPIDYGTFFDNVSRNESIARKVLTRFRRYIEHDLEMLRTAALKMEFDELKDSSHRLKGAAGSLAAGQLAAVLERLEEASRCRDSAAVATAMSALELEIERVDQCIEMLLGEAMRGRTAPRDGGNRGR